MTEQLNPEKAKKLRPLRIVLAILIAALIIVVLDRLPTSKKTITTKNETNQSAEQEGKTFYRLSGFLELLESRLEQKLQALGVPEEEYENVREYLTKDELFELETKATLAIDLENTYINATEEELSRLREIFSLNDDYSFNDHIIEETNPEEYKNLSELLSKYDETLNTTEDYDIEDADGGADTASNAK